MGNKLNSDFRPQNLKPVRPIQNNGYGTAQVVSFSSHPDELYTLKTRVFASEHEQKKYLFKDAALRNG